MSYTLRPYQVEAVEAGVRFFMDLGARYNALMMLPTGCHAVGTGILMADGSVKPVEFVVEGESVMGPDSKPREVLSLCRGTGLMYRITPHRGGKPFIVNEDHVLSLVSTNEGKLDFQCYQRGGEQQFVTVMEYLKKAKSWKHLRKLHRSRTIIFAGNGMLPIPPWILGVILGDGCLLNGGVNITTPDNEIIRDVKRFAEDWGLDIRVANKRGNAAVDLHIIKRQHKYNKTIPNILTNELRLLDLAEKGSADKFVPEIYKTASVESRLEILAGLLDTDGHQDGHGGYDFISKSTMLAGDVAYIARSLGISVHESLEYKQSQNGTGGYYSRLHLSGDTAKIPCRVERKKAPARRQKKNNLVTGFTIEPMGEGEFYGFNLSGDHLYLTSDFFVHHNSGKSLCVAGIAQRLDGPVLVFQPSKEILEQNLAKYESYGYRAAVYSASKDRREIGHVTFATIGSVKNRPDLFREFRYVIIDECHGVCAKNEDGMYTRFLRELGDVKVCGLSATPYRLVTDGFGGSILKFLTRTRPRVFKELIYYVQNGDLFREGYLARLQYTDASAGFDRGQLKLNSTGADYDDDSVARYYAKSGFMDRVAAATRRAMTERKNALIFTRFVEDGEKLMRMVPGVEMVTAESTKREREAVVGHFRLGITKAVVNCNCLAVGFDYPELETVILARPTMSLALYYQQCGRGIRPHPEKEYTEVIDLCGNYQMFGKVEDLKLVNGGHGMWYIESNGVQLTNIYYGNRGSAGAWRGGSPTSVMSGTVEHETEKAYLLRHADGRELWWPKSKLEIMARDGRTITARIPKWLAADKGMTGQSPQMAIGCKE
jgi:hypothetical protein